MQKTERKEDRKIERSKDKKMRDRKSSGQVLCMCDWNVPYAIETDKQICLEKLIFFRVFSLSKYTETLLDHITFLKWQVVLDVT